jgi:hypothetical protein
MTTGFDAIDQDNQHSHMDNGGDTFLLFFYKFCLYDECFLTCCPFLDGFSQHDENTLVADAVDGSTQHGDQNHITNKGDSLVICFPYFILFQLINICMQSFKSMIILDQCSLAQ